MASWNETHYARAEEFLRVLGSAVATSGAAAPTSAPAPAAAVAEAPPAEAPPPTPAAPPAKPTAASVFKKIPWGKK